MLPSFQALYFYIGPANIRWNLLLPPLAPSSPSILIIQQICPAVTLAPVFLANLVKWAISQNREKPTVLFDAVNLKVMSMHEWIIWLDDCSRGEVHSNVSPSPTVLDTPTDDSPGSTNVAPSTPTLNSIAASVSSFDPFFFWCDHGFDSGWGT